MCLPVTLAGRPLGRRPRGQRTPPYRQRAQAVPQRQRARSPPPPQCTPDSKTFWMRNTCEDGFLTVIKNRALVQTTGLDVHHHDAEIVKESCFLSASGPSPRPFVRYLHKSSNRYLCFNKHGKIRTMTPHKASRRGPLCMFLEEQLETVDERVYHRVRSAHNPAWYLGFNPRRTTGVGGGGGGSPSRAALPRIGGVGFRQKKCDFKFFSGRHSPKDIKHEWKGIFDLLETLDTTQEDGRGTHHQNSPVINTKAAKDNFEEVPGPPSSSSTEEEEDASVLGNSVKTGPNAGGSERKPVKQQQHRHVKKKKISSAHREKLQMQQFLARTRKRRIRHFKHKKSRFPRRPRTKKSGKNKRLSKIGQKRSGDVTSSSSRSRARTRKTLV